jgi:hypothetical protein
MTSYEGTRSRPSDERFASEAPSRSKPTSRGRVLSPPRMFSRGKTCTSKTPVCTIPRRKKLHRKPGTLVGTHHSSLVGTRRKYSCRAKTVLPPTSALDEWMSVKIDTRRSSPLVDEFTRPIKWDRDHPRRPPAALSSLFGPSCKIETDITW